MANRKSGVYDPGAASGGVSEADQSLLWGLTLKHVLSSAGIEVWMTRTDDRKAASLRDRASKAETEGCTHFLSIHFNAGHVLASGVETFYRDAIDLKFAKLVQSAALKATGLKDRGVKHERETAVGSLSIMGFNGPCALVEPGFITSPKDRKVIQSRDVRVKFANELLKAWGVD